MIETSSKWVPCDAPGRPAGSVVCDALCGRLAVVSQYLHPTSADDGPDGELVHQLRVATRRSGAAMAALADFLPRGKAKRMRRMLKRIRQAAGAARDFDVLAGRYRVARAAVSDSTQDWLWARISDARRAAQPALDKVFRRYGRGRFARRAERLSARLGWRGDGGEPTFAALAKEQLDRAAGEFFQIAQRRRRSAAELHKFRIAAKRFRYTLELFSAVADGLREEVYPVIEEVQQRLGTANDHTVAAGQFAVWRRRATDAAEDGFAEGGAAGFDGVEIEAIAKRERKNAAAGRREFLQWWTVDRCQSLRRRFDESMASNT